MGAVGDVIRHIELTAGRRAVSVRFILREAAGSLGDLGTFIPIVVGMVQIVGLDAGTVLIFAGLMNVLTGLGFGIPIAVQPMKAIAAIAIAGGLNAAQVAVAGLTAGLLVLMMGLLRLIERLNRIIPQPVVRGLQMTVAFQLLVSGVRLGLYSPETAALRPLWGPDGLFLFVAALALLLLLRRRLGWAAVSLLVMGFIGASFKNAELFRISGFSLWQPRWIFSDSSAVAGVWLGGLPQLPLTLLNSVLAVSVLAGQLFPQSRESTAPTRVAISVGLMNLLACPFGAMPVCHGSGGLAGQYRLGARSGLSMVMLGTAKLIIGLLFGAAALAWMHAFPSSILGVFLIVAAAGLAGASRCWVIRPGLLTAFVMIAVHLATSVLLLGFACGWIAYAVLSRASNGRRVPDQLPLTATAETNRQPVLPGLQEE